RESSFTRPVEFCKYNHKPPRSCGKLNVALLCNPQWLSCCVIFTPRQSPGIDLGHRARTLLLPACGNRHDSLPELAANDPRSAGPFPGDDLDAGMGFDVQPKRN